MTPAPYDGRIPFWVGGAPTDITARRIADHGYGWITSIQASLEDIERGVEVILQGCERRGRSADSVAVLAQLGLEQVARPSLEESLLARVEHLQGLTEEILGRGATHVALPLGTFARDRAEAETLVRSLVGSVAILP
jgi:alkanesulfonate monooxygenase SsuD/methylene tetrahydromethanopterin reductase-like flavin-dependent oxidoreductase (luciferase family)